MSYLNRKTDKHTSGSAELAYLIVVLAAGVSTAWWAGHKIGIDLSSLNAVASVLGLTEQAQSVPPMVGYAPTAQSQAQGQDQRQATAAPYCPPGQAPTFRLGLAALKQQLGDTMGTPVECEHATSAAGNTVQQTTTGLAAYNPSDNTVTFTDGWRHWALTSEGLVAWEGAQSNPPLTAEGQHDEQQ